MFATGPSGRVRIAIIVIGWTLVTMLFTVALMRHMEPVEPVEPVAYSQRSYFDNRQYFVGAARNVRPVTDKVTDHAYDRMYAEFLMPYYSKNPDMKLLEIGLGCDMHYDAGASAEVWSKVFPKADVWFAELDKTCLANTKKKFKAKGISFNGVQGDQSDFAVLDRWVRETGGNFDVVIDDGGHTNCMIYNSFIKLWPHVKPGGYYVMEDLQVGRQPQYNRDEQKCGGIVVADMVKDWIEAMLFTPKPHTPSPNLPAGMTYVACQAEACIVHKGLALGTDAQTRFPQQ